MIARPLLLLGLAACTQAARETADASDDAPADGELATDAPDASMTTATCAHGPTAQTFTRTTDIRYAADHTTTSTTHLPFGEICLPITTAGQAFYLEAKVIRGACNVYDACETSLEVKCFDDHGVLVHPQVWAGENYLNGAGDAALFARQILIAPTAAPLTCRAEFYNHDHGIAGGGITVRAGSKFSASGPLSGTGTTLDTGGRLRLSSARPTSTFKVITGWHLPATAAKVNYIGDVQLTECHTPYPANASDPATQCTTSEPGPNTVVETWAQATEEYPDGSACHVTDGPKVTTTIVPRVHHKMIYNAVADVPHTPGCANTWFFRVHVAWKSGRSVMVQSGPYGQGMVRPH